MKSPSFYHNPSFISIRISSWLKYSKTIKTYIFLWNKNSSYDVWHYDPVCSTHIKYNVINERVICNKSVTNHHWSTARVTDQSETRQNSRDGCQPMRGSESSHYNYSPAGSPQQFLACSGYSRDQTRPEIEIEWYIFYGIRELASVTSWSNQSEHSISKFRPMREAHSVPENWLQ